MTTTKWTVNSIKAAARAAGSHWFDPDTMRTFGTEVMSTVFQGPGGVYFVTKDDQYRRELPKMFTVRQFNPEDASVNTVGELNAFKRLTSAQEEAERLAKGEEDVDVETVTEDFKPVSILEQFVADLDKHASDRSKVNTTDAKRLVTHADEHHKLMERLCSDEVFCRGVDEEGNHPRITACRQRITACVARLGVHGVVFSGDPRGATVKLTFADGFTNDWGKEGYCVPTSLTEEE